MPNLDKILAELKRLLVELSARVSPVIAVAIVIIIGIVLVIMAVIAAIAGYSAFPLVASPTHSQQNPAAPSNTLLNPPLETIEVRIEPATLSQEEVLIVAEVADEETEREIGLMNRTTLAEDAGMLFIYNEPVRASYWMKDTYIPLDIIFVDTEKKITNFALNTEPLNSTQNHTSKVPVKYVLEVPAGTVQKYSLQAGQVLKF